MTIQEAGDEIGKLGFVPEWRWTEDSQQWVNPKTQVRLAVQWLDGRIQYRRIAPRSSLFSQFQAVFSECQTDDCNYGDLQQALRE